MYAGAVPTIADHLKTNNLNECVLTGSQCSVSRIVSDIWEFMADWRLARWHSWGQTGADVSRTLEILRRWNYSSLWWMVNPCGERGRRRRAKEENYCAFIKRQYTIDNHQSMELINCEWRNCSVSLYGNNIREENRTFTLRATKGSAAANLNG